VIEPTRPKSKTTERFIQELSVLMNREMMLNFGTAEMGMERVAVGIGLIVSLN